MLVAVNRDEYVNARLGVSDGVFVNVWVIVAVLVDVPVGSTRKVPVMVAVDVCLSGVTEGTPGVSGVAVHRSGSERREGVNVGTSRVEIGVGGGNGLINEYGLAKILMKMVAMARPASMIIEAKISQNDNFIVSRPSAHIQAVFFSIARINPESSRL